LHFSETMALIFGDCFVIIRAEGVDPSTDEMSSLEDLPLVVPSDSLPSPLRYNFDYLIQRYGTLESNFFLPGVKH